jgi:hypothetical protein
MRDGPNTRRKRGTVPSVHKLRSLYYLYEATFRKFVYSGKLVYIGVEVAHTKVQNFATAFKDVKT